MSSIAPGIASWREPLFADVAGDIGVSFEFFPPKTEKMEQTLWESVKTLEPLGPRFVSVTYGAGGSTRERTHNTVVRIARETSLRPAAHLTCVEASQGEIDDVARAYWDAGIGHIVALRGDPPEQGKAFRPHPGGYANAAALVEGLKKVAPFEISVAAYPECHPDSPTKGADLDNLRRKIDAGARMLLPLPRRCRRGGNRRRVGAGHPPRLERRPDPQVRGLLRRLHPRLDGPAVRRARQSPQRPPARRRDRRSRALRPALCRRGPPVPLLHAEPRRARLRDLPLARAAAEG